MQFADCDRLSAARAHQRPGLLRRTYFLALLLPLLIGGLGGAGAMYWILVRKEPAPDRISTAFYDLTFDRWPLPDGGHLPRIAVYGGHLIAGDAEGRLFNADLAAVSSGAPQFHRLPLHVPTSMKYFSRRKHEKYWDYGVHDLLVTERSGGFHDLYASFGVNSKKAGCPVTRIAVAEAFDRTGAVIEWRTLYETHPCMRLGPGASQSAGGRLQFRDGYLYATIGSHQADMEMLRIGDPARTFPQTNDNSYGKIIRINIRSGAVETLSIGHRNPQGLYIDSSGRIWSTEHGPFGGDELNLIVSGGNYGFPFVTYGADYDLHFWPMSARQNRHDGFVKPIFAWLPSVAISDVIGLEDEGFGWWRGDLLAGSLKEETLYRLRIEDGRVIFSESIPIGHRIRDIAVYDSTVLLSTDDNMLIRIRLEPRRSASPPGH
jgi:hypothetical protein